jgi:LysR family nod box-dependent transcriptional activator
MWKEAGMRFKGLDLNLLVALEVLLECRSTTETARRLNLSQPTISAALGRLRDYFGDDLLVNVGRDMVPTPKAEELSPAITELLNLARFRIVHADDFDPATSRRRFRLLSSDYFFDVLLADALASASALAPDIFFEVSPPGPEATRAFEKGDIDLMITVQTYILPDHPSELLFSDQDAVICCRDGKFAKGIDERAFLDADFAVSVFGESRRSSIADAFFREQGLGLRAAIQVPSFAGLVRAVSGTDRIAVMHLGHARFFERTHPIAVHRLPINGPGVTEIAQWHRLRRNDAGIHWLLGLLREHADRLTAGEARMLQV